MVWAATLILFFSLFAYLAWRNLLWATAATVALLPSYLIRFPIGPFPTTVLEIIVLILFAVWIIKLKINREKLRTATKILVTTKWSWLVSVWLLFATISFIISPNLRAAAGVWKAYFIEPILFLIVFINVIKTKKDLELIFYALGLSALYVSAFAVYQKFTGFAIPNPIWQAAETRRVTSFYGYPNAIGLYLAPIVTLYAGWLIANIQYLISNIKKLSTARYWLLNIGYLLLVIVASVLAIIFARSEGGYVGILAGLFFLGVAIKKLRWPTVAVAIIFVLVVGLVPQFKHYAVEQITFQNDSGKVRLIMWQETWQMLRDRLLSGAGLAGYQETFAPYHKAKYIEIYLYPHNLFLNFWSEVGLGGLIVFLLVTAKFFIFGFKNLKSKIKNRKPLEFGNTLTAATMASMTTILIHGLVDVPYFKNDLAIFFWLLIGLSLVDFKKLSPPGLKNKSR